MGPTETLTSWFRSRETALADVAPDLAQRLRVITGGAERDAALRVHVVGSAGVGKSTLLNALLNDRLSILPHGGFGPHTACAARIRYAPDPYFAIEYRHRSYVEDLLARIAGRTAEREALFTARLLVQGSQFGEVDAEYLLACLSAACGGRLSTRAHEIDRGRLSVLAGILGPGGVRTNERHAGEDLPAFLLDLETHGAGFLSPIVADVAIGWSTELLEGLELVDLPGVGVANDTYLASTREELAGARAVLLVVDRSGLTQDAAELLAPFLRVWASGSLPPAHLVISAIKIDLLADEGRAMDAGPVRRPWVEHFDEACTAMLELIRGQLRAELRRLLGSDGGAAMSELLRTATVRPVAPVEHQRVHRRDPEDPARITTADDSRIAALRSTLVSMAALHRAALATLIDERLEIAARAPRHQRQAIELRMQLAQVMDDRPPEESRCRAT